MSNIVVSGALSAADIRQQVNLIQEVMKAVMQPEVHYGKIPGTDKPTLLKAGSEKILAIFRIAVEPIVEDLSGSDYFRYRVTCRGILPSGEIVGAGVGECSTDEDKYHWRGAVSEKEWEATPENRRRIKFIRPNNYNKDGEVKQVRTNPADLANTVLKMAKKRAQIDLALTSTGASDIFTQDIEDLPEELQTEIANEDQKPKGKPEVKPPQSKKATEAQAKYLPRIKSALDQLHGEDVDAKKALVKKETALPAKGDYPEREGVEDYRYLNDKGLEILAHKLEAMVKKQCKPEVLPSICAFCSKADGHEDACPDNPKNQRDPGAEG